jgi:hypothetical protein
MYQGFDYDNNFVGQYEAKIHGLAHTTTSIYVWFGLQMIVGKESTHVCGVVICLWYAQELSWSFPACPI